MKKRIKLILLIAIIILVPIIIFIPVKKITNNIEVNYEPSGLIDEGTTQLFVKYAHDYEGPVWIVAGKDGTMFTDKRRDIQSVIICGNFPKRINSELTDNIFILYGRYLGKIQYDNQLFNGFEVEDYEIQKPMNRRTTRFLSSNYLTLYDYIVGEKVPVLNKDDFKIVDKLSY